MNRINQTFPRLELPLTKLHMQSLRESQLSKCGIIRDATDNSFNIFTIQEADSSKSWQLDSTEDRQQDCSDDNCESY